VTTTHAHAHRHKNVERQEKKQCTLLVLAKTATDASFCASCAGSFTSLRDDEAALVDMVSRKRERVSKGMEEEAAQQKRRDAPKRERRSRKWCAAFVIAALTLSLPLPFLPRVVCHLSSSASSVLFFFLCVLWLFFLWLPPLRPLALNG
jgi:hypothetical protein